MVSSDKDSRQCLLVYSALYSWLPREAGTGVSLFAVGFTEARWVSNLPLVSDEMMELELHRGHVAGSCCLDKHWLKSHLPLP